MSSLYSRTIQCRVCGFAFQTANAGGTASCLVCGEESKPEPEIKETPKTSVPCPPSPACVEQCRAAHCLRYRNGQPCEHLCSPDKAKPDDKVAGSLPFVPRFADWQIAAAVLLAAAVLFGGTIYFGQRSTENKVRESVAEKQNFIKPSPGSNTAAPLHVPPPVPAKAAPPTADRIAEKPKQPNQQKQKTPAAKPEHKPAAKPESKPQPPVTPEQLAAFPLPAETENTISGSSNTEPALLNTEPAAKVAVPDAVVPPVTIEPPPLKSPEKNLENTQKLPDSPEKRLKEMLYAVKQLNEKSVPLPPEVYYQLGQSCAAVSWGQPFGFEVPPVEDIVSPSDTRLLTQHQDNITRIWSVENTQQKPEMLPDSKPVHYVKIAFSPNRQLLFGGGEDSIIRIWNVSGQKPDTEPILLRDKVPGLQNIQLSPDSRWLAAYGIETDGGTVFLWDLHQIPAGILPSPIHLSTEEPVSAVQFSPDSRLLAVGGQDAAVRIYDLTQKKFAEIPPQRLNGHQLGITALAFSPDGRILASGSSDNTVILWNTADFPAVSNAAVLNGHLGWVNTLVFHPEGTRLFSGSYDNTVRVWNVRSNPLAAADCAAVLQCGQGAIRELMLSPDGKHLVSLGNDGSMRIQPAAGTFDPKQSILFRNRVLPISCAAFTPNGRYLIFGYTNLNNAAESGLRRWTFDIDELIGNNDQ